MEKGGTAKREEAREEKENRMMEEEGKRIEKKQREGRKKRLTGGQGRGRRPENWIAIVEGAEMKAGRSLIKGKLARC